MLARAASTARRRWPFLVIGALTLSCVLFAGLWLGAASATSKRSQDSYYISNVKMTKFDAAESNEVFDAATTGWEDVPNTTKAFKIGGTTARNMLVTVSAEFVLPPNAFLYLRLVIDDVI